MLNGRFISGMMLDTRMFTKFSGIFGLAPPLKGEHLIVQAVCNNSLDAPIITVNGKSKLVTFGAIDNEKCNNWAFVEPLSTNQWVFEVDEIELMGKQANGLNTVHIFKYDNHFLIKRLKFVLFR